MFFLLYMESFLQTWFWILIALVFYSYIGYGFLLYGIIMLKRKFWPKIKNLKKDAQLPEVTFLVAAYNEEDFIEEKIKNTLSLDYPSNKLKLLFITDGSNDATPEIISKYENIILMHDPERNGKIAAVNRAMEQVKTDIVVFSDANTDLNKDALRNIVRHYQDESIGVVAGEKRILTAEKDTASGAGEEIYWKYESTLKKWDSELYSVVGAAGELFSLRTDLYEPVPQDTLIEDFFLSLRIAQKGYRIVYEPDAFTMEGPSASVKEELKRKIRIAAGGLQAITRLTPLLNPFKHGVLSFQYISHRVLRWTLAPLSLPFIFFINMHLALQKMEIYQGLFLLQTLFYIAVAVGYLLEKRNIKLKAFFIPYYFFIMNYAVYRGFFRNMKGNQSVIWEKTKRSKAIKPLN
jgi:poly-beta-1,6-N-acetyl-D-glucosamine synthase